MQSTRIYQISLIACIGVLVAFLFLNGKNNSTALKKDTVQSGFGGKSFDFDLYAKDVKAKLDKKDADEIMLLEGQLKGRGLTQKYKQALAEKYESLNKPAMAGYYFKQLAEAEPSNEYYWFKTGESFFDAEQFVEDEMSYKYFVDESSKALEKTVQLNPGNLEAKADLAMNMVLGKGQPMVGVGMLREILQVDSNNRKALFYMGVFSIQSGQMDKAAQRFEQLISLGPDNDKNYPYYYRYLGSVYAQMAQKDPVYKTKARTAFLNYKQQVTALHDDRLVKEADELLNAIK